MSQMMDLPIMDTMGGLIDYIDEVAKSDWADSSWLVNKLAGFCGMDLHKPFIFADFRIGFNEMVYERYALDYRINNINSSWDETKVNIYIIKTPQWIFM